MIPLNYPKNIVEGFECLDCEFPWITIEAADFLNENLTKEDVVLEFGSGGSTFFFARRCKNITAIETSNEWFDTVFKRLNEKQIDNFIYFSIPEEETILEWIRSFELDKVTVVSVDTQGGYNRSQILSEVLKKQMPSLRMIILDNYAHEGLFPDHWNKESIMGDGWDMLTFDQPDGRWAGKGTRIYIKK